MPNIAARALAAIAMTFAPLLSMTPVFADPVTTEPIAPQVIQQQRACLPHSAVDQAMRQAFGEKLIGQGISNDGTLLEVFMAPTGTFTIIKTSPQGISCVVDSGDGWRTLNQLEQVGFTPDDL